MSEKTIAEWLEQKIELGKLKAAAAVPTLMPKGRKRSVFDYSDRVRLIACDNIAPGDIVLMRFGAGTEVFEAVAWGPIREGHVISIGTSGGATICLEGEKHSREADNFDTWPDEMRIVSICPAAKGDWLVVDHVEKDRMFLKKPSDLVIVAESVEGAILNIVANAKIMPWEELYVRGGQAYPKRLYAD